MATRQSGIEYETSPTEPTNHDTIQTSSQQPDDTTEQLCLLNDTYAREILTVLASGSRCGRELAEACTISRPTVYRRLNRLEAAGFVTSELCPDPDGHHRKEFHIIRDRLRVEINDGSIAVTLDSRFTDGSDTHTDTERPESV